MESEFSYLFTGYIMSYLSNDDIISWADHKILKDNYDDTIINLSLSNNTNMI